MKFIWKSCVGMELQITFHSVWIFNQSRLNSNISHLFVSALQSAKLAKARSTWFHALYVMRIYLYLPGLIKSAWTIVRTQNKKSSPWLVNQRVLIEYSIRFTSRRIWLLSMVQQQNKQTAMAAKFKANKSPLIRMKWKLFEFYGC